MKYRSICKSDSYELDDYYTSFKYSGDYSKSRALIGSLSSDYQPIMTSTNKMACWRAFDEMNFFSCFAMFFLFVFGIITCVFILKQLFAEEEVIISESLRLWIIIVD